MKKNKKQKTIFFLILIIVFISVAFFYLSPKEAKFEDILFKELLDNLTKREVPYELHFSIVNPNFRSINCIATLSLLQVEQINETEYNLGEIPQRTKLKYKLPFIMPIGNTSIYLDKSCTII